MSRRDTGVSLVELMIVVAVIAIVTALAVTGISRGDRTAKFARDAVAATWNARREALAIGTLVYPTDSAYAGESRAPCMPNTQLIIEPTRIRQYNCTLDDVVAPNQLPCTAVADDCAWGDPVRTVEVPPESVIGYVERQNVDTGAVTRVALATEARVYFRPDGNSDACVDCVAAPGLGNPQERLTLLVRPRSVSDETVCETEQGRCFMVLPTARVATRW